MSTTPTTWVDVDVLDTRELAVCVDAGRGEPAWIPRSQIVDESDDIVKGASLSIEIPEWLAVSKGLV
jgi:hypothetical protein